MRHAVDGWWLRQLAVNGNVGVVAARGADWAGGPLGGAVLGGVQGELAPLAAFGDPGHPLGASLSGLQAGQGPRSLATGRISVAHRDGRGEAWSCANGADADEVPIPDAVLVVLRPGGDEPPFGGLGARRTESRRLVGFLLTSPPPDHVGPTRENCCPGVTEQPAILHGEP